MSATEKRRLAGWLQVRVDPETAELFAARCRFFGTTMSERIRQLIRADCSLPVPKGWDPATNHALADALENPAGVDDAQWTRWAHYLRSISGPREG